VIRRTAAFVLQIAAWLALSGCPGLAVAAAAPPLEPEVIAERQLDH